MRLHIGGYHLFRCLGRGRWFDVYVGQHGQTGPLAAIKILRLPLSDGMSEQISAGMQRIAQFTHSHLLPVLGYGRDDGSFFLAVEYAAGGSLRPYPELSHSAIVTLILPIAGALHFAHQQGIYHGNLKPENILVADGCLLLGDFEGAIVANASQEHRHCFPAQALSRSLAHMAPERRYSPPSRASDQYSLASIVYEWICGSVPFQAPSSWGQAGKEPLVGAPTPPHNYVPGISRQFETVLLKALAWQPEERYTSVQEFALALEKAGLP